MHHGVLASVMLLSKAGSKGCETLSGGEGGGCVLRGGTQRWDIVLRGVYGVINAQQGKGAASGRAFDSRRRNKVVWDAWLNVQFLLCKPRVRTSRVRCKEKKEKELRLQQVCLCLQQPGQPRECKVAQVCGLSREAHKPL